MTGPERPRRPPAIGNRSAARSVAAILGLVLSLAAMWWLGLGGLVYGFLFGAGGAVIGGVAGERLHDWSAKR